MGSMNQTSVQRWLQDHCESSGLVAGGLVITAGTDGTPSATVAEWPAGSSAISAPLAAAAQAAVQRSRPVVVTPGPGGTDTRHNRLLSMPLVSGDRTLGAVALAVDAGDGSAINSLFESLGRASAHIGDSLGQPPVDQDPARDAARVLALQDSLLRQPTLAEGALALVSELAPLLGATRVTLGVIDDGAVDVVAVSNSAEFKAEQDLLKLIAAAMQEAADQGRRVVYPVASTDPIRIVLAHADLHERTGSLLASVALVQGGRAVGSLLAEWRSTTPPSPHQLDLLDSAACALGAADRAAPACRAALERAHRRCAARRLAAPDPPQRPAAEGDHRRRGDPDGGAAARFRSPGGSVHRPASRVRCSASSRRRSTATCRRSHVRPGDTVHAGDVLVELADQDLLLEQRRWEGALAQHENGYAAALARADRAQFVITQGKAGEARAQLDLVRQQLARTRLVAPIDGVVIKGDLSQGLGAPVQRGDALITIAPAERYRLIVSVDERDIAAIQPGQPGRLALASLPADPLDFVVERVTPVAVVQDGRNAFEVEARLLAAAPLLRPGLQGIARSRPATVRPPGSGPTARSTGCAWRCGRGGRSGRRRRSVDMSASLFSVQWYRVAALRPQLRTQVKVRRQQWRDQCWYLLSDGATGRQHRINAAAYQFIGRCDGRHTAHEVWNALLEDDPDAAPSQDEVLALLGQLNENELLQSERAASAETLLQRRDTRRKRRRREMLNPFSFRLPLGDPSGWLPSLDPLGRLLFTPAAFAVWLLAMLAFAIAAAMEWPALRLQASQQLFSSANLAIAWIVYPLMKALHELGARDGGAALGRRGARGRHGSAVPGAGAVCRCLGGGAFARRTQRAAVGAAGLIVELSLAGARLRCLDADAARAGARHRLRGAVHRHRLDAAVQRQPAAALRRLPRDVRPVRRAESRHAQRRLVEPPAGPAAARQQRRTAAARAERAQMAVGLCAAVAGLPHRAVGRAGAVARRRMAAARPGRARLCRADGAAAAAAALVAPGLCRRPAGRRTGAPAAAPGAARRRAGGRPVRRPAAVLDRRAGGGLAARAGAGAARSRRLRRRAAARRRCPGQAGRPAGAARKPGTAVRRASSSRAGSKACRSSSSCRCCAIRMRRRTSSSRSSASRPKLRAPTSASVALQVRAGAAGRLVDAAPGRPDRHLDAPGPHLRPCAGAPRTCGCAPRCPAPTPTWCGTASKPPRCGSPMRRGVVLPARRSGEMPAATRQLPSAALAVHGGGSIATDPADPERLNSARAGIPGRPDARRQPAAARRRARLGALRPRQRAARHAGLSARDAAVPAPLHTGA